MDWADEIAYSVHDFEDGMKSGMINSTRLKTLNGQIEGKQLDWMLKEVLDIESQPTERSRKAARKRLTSRLIHEFVTATTRQEVTGLPTETSIRYCYRLEIEQSCRERATALKALMLKLMVQDERVATLENKAERIVEGLFSIFSRLDDRTAYLFPTDFRDLWRAGDNEGKLRVACDYIAGMTDDYAEKVYARLFLPQAGSIYNV
jgi:dGTPase